MIAAAFAPIAHLTVGDFRDWLLADTDDAAIARRACARASRPEMAAAVSKLMRNQDLILAAQQMPRRHALSLHHRAARDAVGAPAAQSPDRRPARHRRLDPRRPAARRGDAVIGINPATRQRPT